MLIKVSAYLQHNLGDDLMVELLTQRYPQHTFYGCIPWQKKTKKLEASNFVDQSDIWRKHGRMNHILNILTFYKKRDFYLKYKTRQIENKCDYAIAIGGSIYRPVKNETIDARLERERRKHATNGSLFVISANFGPYQDESFYLAFKEYFKTCSGITFRDNFSRQLFNELDNICWAPDIVFNLPVGELHDQGTVVVSVIAPETRPAIATYAENYYDKLSQVCSLAAKQKKQVILASFCKGEGDESAIKLLLSKIEAEYYPQITTYFYDGDTEEALTVFRNAGQIIATRFHSMVLGMRFSKQLFTISYELKMENVLRETGSTAWCSIGDLSKLSPEEILNRGKDPIPVDGLVQQATEQFRQLDTCLKKANEGRNYAHNGIHTSL